MTEKTFLESETYEACRNQFMNEYSRCNPMTQQAAMKKMIEEQNSANDAHSKEEINTICSKGLVNNILFNGMVGKGKDGD